MIYPLDRGHIPYPQVMDKKRYHSISFFPEILIIHIPCIPHRRKHIRNMESIRWSNNPFGHAMTAAQDKVIPFEIETFYRHREQGKIFSVTLFRKREILNKGRRNGQSFDTRRNRTRHVQQSVKISLGKKFAKDFKTPFPSPHTRKPVMDNGYFHQRVISFLLFLSLAGSLFTIFFARASDRFQPSREQDR